MTSSNRDSDMRRRFRGLHTSGMFLMPNPWDVGSAKLLAALGFPALATTSSGMAATLGRGDQQVTRAQLVEHVAALVAAVDVPVNVDAEYGFAADSAALKETVEQVAATGAAGVSLEDYNPDRAAIDPLPEATERLAAAAEVARARGLVLTARAENHLYGVDDLVDTIARLVAYREVGADVVYAPGLIDLGSIARVVAEVDAPVNVLALPGGPTTGELAEAGVRRVSTGGSLAWAAYGAAVRAAAQLRQDGAVDHLRPDFAGLDPAEVFG